jgi:hypothetical protein
MTAQQLQWLMRPFLSSSRRADKTQRTPPPNSHPLPCSCALPRASGSCLVVIRPRVQRARPLLNLAGLQLYGTNGTELAASQLKLTLSSEFYGMYPAANCNDGDDATFCSTGEGDPNPTLTVEYPCERALPGSRAADISSSSPSGRWRAGLLLLGATVAQKSPTSMLSALGFILLKPPGSSATLVTMPDIQAATVTVHPVVKVSAPTGVDADTGLGICPPASSVLNRVASYSHTGAAARLNDLVEHAFGGARFGAPAVARTRAQLSWSGVLEGAGPAATYRQSWSERVLDLLGSEQQLTPDSGRNETLVAPPMAFELGGGLQAARCVFYYSVVSLRLPYIATTLLNFGAHSGAGSAASSWNLTVRGEYVVRSATMRGIALTSAGSRSAGRRPAQLAVAGRLAGGAARLLALAVERAS